jgi:hypothetical protein
MRANDFGKGHSTNSHRLHYQKIQQKVFQNEINFLLDSLFFLPLLRSVNNFEQALHMGVNHIL